MPYDLDDAKGVLELICRRLGFAAPAYTPITDDPNLHPGRAARVQAGGHLVGRVGELHPETIAALDLRAERIYVAEVARRRPRRRQPRRLSRDGALAASRRSSATWRSSSRSRRRPATVEAAIRRHGGPLLRDVALFDIYRGQPLAETDKSLAYRLTLARRRADADRGRAR